MVYEINSNTLAILPSYTISHGSKVYEEGLAEPILVKENPFKIIQENCILHFSSYRGRRESVLHYTTYRKKIPIPISIIKGMIAFPTQSVTNMNCSWIFSKNIARTKAKKDGTAIIFKDDTTLFFKGSSLDSIHRQMARCSDIANLLDKSNESFQAISKLPQNYWKDFLLKELIKKYPFLD